jgi:hypothetical protein
MSLVDETQIRSGIHQAKHFCPCAEEPSVYLSASVYIAWSAHLSLPPVCICTTEGRHAASICYAVCCVHLLGHPTRCNLITVNTTGNNRSVSPKVNSTVHSFVQLYISLIQHERSQREIPGWFSTRY